MSSFESFQKGSAWTDYASSWGASFSSYDVTVLLLLIVIGNMIFYLRSLTSMVATFLKLLHWRTVKTVFPVYTELAIGLGWSMLSYPTPLGMIWVAMKMFSWCKTAVWSFRGHEKIRGHVAFTIDDAPGRGEPYMQEVGEKGPFDRKCLTQSRLS